MWKRLLQNHGYSLIELVVVLVIVGIIASVALRALRGANEVSRVEETRREMDRLAWAIAGNPALVSGGVRADYGYVGDVGALPPNLDALAANPGGYATWDGPYIYDEFSSGGAGTGFKVDAWGMAYQYTGGIDIVSTGGGQPLTRRVAASTAHLLYNVVAVAVTDLDGTPPGTTWADSVSVTLTYPDGAGGWTTRSVAPAPDGFVQFDSIPVGLHTLRVVFLPNADTLTRTINVDPGRGYAATLALPWELWSGTGGGGGCGVSSPIVLRPDGPGALTDLTASGCTANWQCVAEATADEDATRVTRSSGGKATDVYSFSDPTDTTCTITSVAVSSRVRDEDGKGEVKLTLYIGGNTYRSQKNNVGSAYANYSYLWNTNPATGLPWTWQDIIALQAGVELKGKGGNKNIHCTQVWVEIYLQ